MSKNESNEQDMNVELKDVDTTDSIIPAARALNEAIIAFREAAESFRAVIDISAQIKNEKWLSYCYQNINYT